jgi:aquaporin Z
MPSTGFRGGPGKISAATVFDGPWAALKSHWPEYLIEAAALACFMISACVFGVLLEHPVSPLNRAIEEPAFRRILVGIAMGCTAIAIVHSPWGRRSGAHMNPSITWTYYLLGKIAPWDAAFYAVFQFLGGIAGVALAAHAIGRPLGDEHVNYVVTAPGPDGAPAAFAGEFATSAILIYTILTVSNRRGLAPFTPLFAGALVAAFISIESPLSGMSMNPARSLGSAVFANEWTSLWIYFAAPTLGMMLAAFLYCLRHGLRRVFCAKLHHENNQRCIFRCNYGSIYDD